jgi:hypothetical protein
MGAIASRQKMLRKIAGRKRLSEHFRQELGNEMFELGFVFLDMETYYAIASVRAFESYRRLGEGSFETVDDRKKKHSPLSGHGGPGKIPQRRLSAGGVGFFTWSRRPAPSKPKSTRALEPRRFMLFGFDRSKRTASPMSSSSFTPCSIAGHRKLGARRVFWNSAR